MKELFNTLKKHLREFDSVSKQKAIDDLEWETQEMKHIFALATMGTFIGMPAAPLPVMLELFPDMHEEFAILLSKINTAHSPLSEQFSRLDAV
ncbi:MAG: hypothetical protein KDF60_20450 [Calditrichaeota bacterium]|nr:hypothetical protein [Calditrichota bacterium]